MADLDIVCALTLLLFYVLVVKKGASLWESIFCVFVLSSVEQLIDINGGGTHSQIEWMCPRVVFLRDAKFTSSRKRSFRGWLKKKYSLKELYTFIIFSVSDRSDSILELTGNNFLFFPKFHLFSLLYFSQTWKWLMSTSLISDQWTLLSWFGALISWYRFLASPHNSTKQSSTFQRERSVDLELSLFVTKEKEWTEANRPINPLESQPREAADWLSVTISSSVFPIRPLSDYSTRAFRSTHYDNTRSQYIEKKRKNRGREKNRSTLLAALTTKMHSVTITIVLTVISVASSKKKKKTDDPNHVLYVDNVFSWSNHWFPLFMSG